VAFPVKESSAPPNGANWRNQEQIPKEGATDTYSCGVISSTS